MRVQKRNPWLYSLGVVLAAMALWGTRAGADVTSDRPGSVLIWPKVIADGTRDTLITLTNTRNETAYAHCEYVNAIGVCSISQQNCTLPSSAAVASDPACPGGTADICQLQWQSSDFDVTLTRQQPTIWRVSTGRFENLLLPANGTCVNGPGPLQSCPGFFHADQDNIPGAVLPVVQPFAGELRCIQTAMDLNTPIASNGLKGEATIETLGSTQISEYNSINVLGQTAPESATILRLNGIEYNACPEAVEFTNQAAGSDDPVAASIDPSACTSSGCPVTSEITVIPCRADYENEIPTRFQLHILYTNEFEQELSVDRSFNCWTSFTLENLGFTNVGGSTFQRTRIIPSGSGLCIQGDANTLNTACSQDSQCGGADGVCAPATGVLSVVEEFHATDTSALTPTALAAVEPGTAAANGYSVDSNNDGLLGRPGHCRGALATSCMTDADCPTGKCRATGAACDANTQCGAGDFCDQCMNDEIRLPGGF
jgi:hypothetical protein